MSQGLENPVRRKPDYGEVPFDADELADEVARTASLIVEDWKHGVHPRLPIPWESVEDAMIRAGAGHRLGESEFGRQVADRVNGIATEVMNRRGFGSIGPALARAFAEAIDAGVLPRLKSYAREQAAEFVRGAMGDGPQAEKMLASFAAAHNHTNGGHGRIEVEGPRLEIVAFSELAHVRAVMRQLGDWSEEQDAEGLRFYPVDATDSSKMWEVVRTMGAQFPELDFTVGDDGTELAHVRVVEATPSDPVRDYPGMFDR